jgi:hypothetical protein
MTKSDTSELVLWKSQIVGPRGGMYSVPADEFSKLVRRLQVGKAVVCTTESGSDQTPDCVK